MKKQILFALLLIGCAGITRADSSNNPCCGQGKVTCVPVDCCECKVNSHTFHSDRPLFQIASPEYETMFRDRMHARPDGIEGAVQIVPFGSRSTKSARLATYFTPFCKSSLVVSEQIADEPDVLAQNLNIVTVNGTFKSKIQFCPRRTEAGIGLSYKQSVYEREDGRSLWIAFSAPITNVRPTMGLREEIISDGGGARQTCQLNLSGPSEQPRTTRGQCAQVTPEAISRPVGSALEAFRQCEWECGKIDCRCNLSETRLANLDFLFGFETVKHEECYCESYVGITIPTGNRVEAKHLYEPIVGYNHHFGIQFGSNLGLRLWNGQEEDKNLWFNMAMRGLYLIHNCQHRLVDLKFKPWSRYMRTFSSVEQAIEASDTQNFCLHTPGASVFCLPMCVRPGLQRTYNTALTYTSGTFEGEVGLNFFWREAECVGLKCPWQEGPALHSRGNQGGYGGTDSVQMINNDFDGANVKALIDYPENIIKQSDLDLESASHPAMATHTMYGSLGWRFDDRNFPPFFGLGGSYEFADDNTALDRWTIWAKAGLSF